MSEIGRRIDEVIRGGLATRLKEHGYRKSGRSFHAHGPDHRKVVSIQASRSNEGAEGSFTINLGVYFPKVAQLARALPLKGQLKEYDCTVRNRLGPLMHAGRDVWWSIGPSTAIADLSTKVGTAWAVFGRPWLDRASTLPGAHAELVEQRIFFVAAVISVILDRRDEAADLIRRAMEQQPLAADRIVDWGHQNWLL